MFLTRPPTAVPRCSPSPPHSTPPSEPRRCPQSIPDHGPCLVGGRITLQYSRCRFLPATLTSTPGRLQRRLDVWLRCASGRWVPPNFHRARLPRLRPPFEPRLRSSGTDRFGLASRLASRMSCNSGSAFAPVWHERVTPHQRASFSRVRGHLPSHLLDVAFNICMVPSWMLLVMELFGGVLCDFLDVFS